MGEGGFELPEDHRNAWSFPGPLVPNQDLCHERFSEKHHTRLDHPPINNERINTFENEINYFKLTSYYKN